MTKLWTPGERDQQWQLGYNSLYSIINDASLIIMPLGDPRYFDPAVAGGFKTTGDIQATFTPSSDPRTWATPYNHTQDSSYTPGLLIPQLTFDGSANEFDSPDADAWSFGADGTAGNEPAMSMGLWWKTTTLTGSDVPMSKYNSNISQQEWYIEIKGGKPRFTFYDASFGAYIGRDDTNTLSTNRWYNIVCTYSASRTSAGINIYVNGADADDANFFNGPYTAMENKTASIALGYLIGSAGTKLHYIDGSMAGASCCPWIVGKELTADEVNRIYRMQHSQMFGYYP